MTESGADRLNLGCGHDIRPDWVNHDVAPLPGVDVVHDLEEYPWPFPDDAFREIEMINVLEHLSDTSRAMEELHRISAPGGRVLIRVPYWNSPDYISDPTHKARFNEHTFEFFDPATKHGKERSYYSSARFTYERLFFYVRILGRYIRVGNRVLNRFLACLARHFGGIVWVEEVELRALK